MASRTEPHGSHGAETIRLIASNGEPVWVDDETGEVVARQSPGREWDTWRIQSAGDDPKGRVHLIAPSGNAVTLKRGEGLLRATATLAQADGIDIVPLGDHGHEHEHEHEHEHDDNGHGHGSEDDIVDTVAPAVALRTAAGDCVGLEPTTDRLVVRSSDVTSTDVFMIERVDAEPENVFDRCEVAPGELAVTGVHAVVLSNGDVLYFSYRDRHVENSIYEGRSQLWNPGVGPIPNTYKTIGRNLFCAGHCWLGDGRVLVAGGQSNNFPLSGIPYGYPAPDQDVHTFAPPETWVRKPNLAASRYYPTCVTLANGNGFIASGEAVRVPKTPNDDYEIFDARLDRCGPKLRFRPQNTSFLEWGDYPFLQLLYNGSDQGLLFVFSRNEARLFDLGAGKFRAKSFKTASPGARTYPHQGAAVMLPQWANAPWKSRIMVIGGQSRDDETTYTAEIFEYDGGNPNGASWRSPKGGKMRTKRFMGDAVLLPDETVLVVNGAGRGEADKSYAPVYITEVFDSRAETWRFGARINRPRLYHSSAMLLADGRVAIAGNTYTFNPGNEVEDRTVELYSPAYVFRPRPQIGSAPHSVPYGERFRIGTPTPRAIDRVAMLRAATVTHTNNMDQRHLMLPIVQRGAGWIEVDAPPHGTIAPPGPWMLFLLNAERVPSVGRFLWVRQAIRDAAYVSMEAPTHMKVGEKFTGTVTMRNTGTLTWRSTSGYRLGSQAPQDNKTWGLNRVELPGDVGPDGAAIFRFEGTAPSQPGVYAFVWRMVHERVAWFGATTAPMRITVASANEDPACDEIRAELEQIGEAISNLSDALTGDPKKDAPIRARISKLQTKAREAKARGESLGCVLGLVSHH